MSRAGKQLRRTHWPRFLFCKSCSIGHPDEPTPLNGLLDYLTPNSHPTAKRGESLVILLNVAGNV